MNEFQDALDKGVAVFLKYFTEYVDVVLVVMLIAVVVGVALSMRHFNKIR